MTKSTERDDGYWGAGNAGGFGGTVAHWWVIGEGKDKLIAEGKDKSLCGIEMRPIDIAPAWGRPRCKRCVKALVARQEKEAEKSMRNMTEADFLEAHG